tara:strand:- start:2461 stop:2922 length:462 start_codon:yes stop_codon:yes gene_type:complete
MKIIVAGGRDYFDEIRIGEELGKLQCDGVFGNEDPELVCGMAPGTDLTAKEVFESAGFIVHKRPADWKNLDALPCIIKSNRYGEYNALAGHNRNKTMGDESELAVVFWSGSSGTKNMIDYMKKLGKPIYIFYYGAMAHKPNEAINETSTRPNR